MPPSTSSEPCRATFSPLELTSPRSAFERQRLLRRRKLPKTHSTASSNGRAAPVPQRTAQPALQLRPNGAVPVPTLVFQHIQPGLDQSLFHRKGSLGGSSGQRLSSQDVLKQGLIPSCSAASRATSKASPAPRISSQRAKIQPTMPARHLIGR